jgi:DNA-binding IclR family transcriptional regulator
LTGHALTRQVRRFIVEHLETDTDLDVLLVLQRHPESCWDAVRLAGVLRIHRDQADRILARMAANGLARADQSRYRYEPARAGGHRQP